MSRRPRSSEWLALRRALLILQRLAQGPAKRDELIAYVSACQPDAYPVSPSARDRAFKRDRENIRRHLGAQIGYAPATGAYTLDSPGPFVALRLSERSLRALRLLSQTFTQPLGEHTSVIALLNELIARLPDDDRRALDPAQPLSITLDLNQSVEPSPVPSRVWGTAQRALRERRALCFNYRPLDLVPSSKPRRYKVLPLETIYRDGHFYLKAALLAPPEARGEVRHFRLSAVVDDNGLVVLPERVGALPLRQPRYEVRYRLLPPLARRVSARFDDMQVTPLEDGSVEVVGQTDNALEAVRVLLSYGEHCVVLGGDEVLRRWRRAVEGMCRHLGDVTLATREEDRK